MRAIVLCLLFCLMGNLSAVGAQPDQLGVFRPGSARWFIDFNASGHWDGCLVDGCSGSFGTAGDLPAVADWNGDGSADIGVFRAASGQWYFDLNGNRSWDAGIDGIASFGQAGDLPAVGDWNGDGFPEIGVFRPASGQWYFDLNGNRSWDAGIDGVASFGQTGDLPAVGDWNGDGLAEIGVFRASSGQWHFDLNGNLAWDGCLVDGCFGPFGIVGDLPVAAFWWPAIDLELVTGGLVQPLHITHAGDGSDRLFLTERGGRVRIHQDGQLLVEPFLDLSSQVTTAGGEQGLLSIAFPPGFSEKQYFYASYTGQTGIGDSVLSRIQMSADPNQADPASEAVLLQVVQPFANHNGGQLAFGPDGLLYFGLGDGGGAGDPQGNAQDLGTLLGKMLRLDVESGSAPYVVPADNPFGDEIWAYGLRNPWRFAFDRQTGDLFIADVGQGNIEEVDVQPATSVGGENYGWNIMEGTVCFSDPDCDTTGLILPVTTYPHTEGNCSVTGGYVYRGTAFPELTGIYLYGDYCSGRIWGLRRSGTTWQSTLLLDANVLISSFGEDEAGNLYLTDYGNGILYQVLPRDP
jgi:glucose/arabinose dehydrogenase